MFDYPRYFNEWNVPPSGIDTISIWIHPGLVKKHSLFHEYGNNNESINLRIKRYIDPRTNKILQINYSIDIQAEAINYNDNILGQIFQYILNLFKSEILGFSNNPDESLDIPLS
jgi:hypothetical protein